MEHLQVIPAELLQKVTFSALALSSEDSKPPNTLPSILEEYGFAVVTDVLSAADIAHAEALFDADLSSIVDLPDKAKAHHPLFSATSSDDSRSIAARWPLQKFPLGAAVPAFASDYGIPHGRCAWFVRQHPNLRRVFSELYGGCEELCCGCDNLFFCNDRERPSIPDEEREDRLWPHVDQSAHIEGGASPCFQSVVYLWSSNEQRSTTVVWPKSHATVYPRLMEEREFKSHFCRVPKTYWKNYVKEAVRVVVPAGGMIVWSSRTVHQGWNVGPRLAVPVSMEPRARRSSQALERKKSACLSGLPTTHWASLGIIHGVASPGGRGTESFPLVRRAHEWLIQADGSLDPQVEALL